MDAVPIEPPAPVPSGLRRLLGNLARLLGGKAAAGLLSLVYLVIVAHQLGARDYGILVLINAYAVTIGSLVAFSGFHGVVRYGAMALAREDRAGLAHLVRFMALVELGFGLLAMLVAAVLVPLVGPRLGWPPELRHIAILYSLAVLGTVRATPQGVLQLADRFDLIGLHQTVSPVARILGVFLVLAIGGGLEAFLLVWLVSSVAEGLAMWGLAIPAWRALVGGEAVLGRWRGVLRERAGFGRFILVTNFDITLRELAPNLAPLTVGWLLGPAAAGLLALAQRATNAIQQPAVLLSQASYAVLAEQVARARLDLLRATVWRGAALALFAAALIVLLLALVGDRLLVLIGGGSFAGATMLVLLVGCGRGLGLGAAPLAAALTALGRPGRSVTAALAANLALYPLLPLLLLWRGVDGAGWHVLIQNMLALGLLARFFIADGGRPHA